MLVAYLAAAVLGDEGDTLAVRVVVAVLALQALLEQAAQQLLAVAAHGGPRVRVHLERVGDGRATPAPAAAPAAHRARARRRPRRFAQLFECPDTLYIFFIILLSF